MPLISVIMSTYRENESVLRESIDSILSQTVTDFEFLIVSDDPDNTNLLHLLTDYTRRDHRITLLRNDTNCGLVASLNRALETVRGEYVARMDADDIAEPTRFEKQLAYLHRENLDLTGSSVIRINEHGTPLTPPPNHTDAPHTVMSILRIAPCVPHPTWLAKTAVYTALSGYRDMPRCEDYDFLLRALRRGFRIGICPAPLLRYRIASHGISRSALLEQHYASRYLAREFPRIEQVTPAELHRITTPITAERNARYRQAEALFYTALTHRGWRRTGYLLASLAVSRDQPRRFYDMWRIHRTRQGG